MSTMDDRRERASAGVALRDTESWEDGFARPRVFLTPIAAPSILGLAGFSVATFMVGSIQAGWWGSIGDFGAIAPFALTFGGIAQFTAGVVAYRARDGVATLAHGTWGAFWIAFGILQFLILAHALPAPSPTAPQFVLGLWFIGLAYITLTAALGAIAENIGVFSVLITLAAGSGMTASGLLIGGFDSWITHVGGILFVISAGLAWYVVNALVLAGSFRRTILPIGAWKKDANIPSRKPFKAIELEWAEPGVKKGQ